MQKRFNKKVKILGLIVLLQIIYGAFTAGLKAGFGNYLFSDIFVFPNEIKSFINDGSTVLLIHRYLAIAILIYTIYIYFTSIRTDSILPHQTKGLHLILITVFGQVLLGVLALLNSVPISLGILHQAGAVLVITSCVYLIRRS